MKLDQLNDAVYYRAAKSGRAGAMSRADCRLAPWRCSPPGGRRCGRRAPAAGPTMKHSQRSSARRNHNRVVERGEYGNVTKMADICLLVFDFMPIKVPKILTNIY